MPSIVCSINRAMVPKTDLREVVELRILHGLEESMLKVDLREHRVIFDTGFRKLQVRLAYLINGAGKRLPVGCRFVVLYFAVLYFVRRPGKDNQQLTTCRNVLAKPRCGRIVD